GAGGVAAIGDESSGDSDLNAPFKPPEAPVSRGLDKVLPVLGDYRLTRKLGEGAMGAVYQATRISSNAIVALKVLFPHVANNPKLVERLRREGLAMGMLDHPNIVRAFEVHETAGYHYVAMEYVPGQSMQKWLKQIGSLPVADAVRITLDCTRALEY